MVLGMWCGYIYCGRGVVAVVLGMLCGVVVVGSKGGTTHRRIWGTRIRGFNPTTETTKN